MSDFADIRLFFLRHGETERNRELRMQGQSDEGLNERGWRQADRAAERLSFEKIDAIYTSDLVRARETAERVAQRFGLPVHPDRRLREQHLGEWEGKPWPDLVRIFGEEEVAGFIGDPEHAPPGGETKRKMLGRILGAVEEIAIDHHGGTVLVVTHGGPLLAFLHHALELPHSPRKRCYGSNAGLSEFARVEGNWLLLTFDETFHLRGA